MVSRGIITGECVDNIVKVVGIAVIVIKVPMRIAAQFVRPSSTTFKDIYLVVPSNAFAPKPESRSIAIAVGEFGVDFVEP